jgi:N-acetylglucosaminyldiphosphoundecaprenol N-acetyl-beta-D-mannosaminyltransferase
MKSYASPDLAIPLLGIPIHPLTMPEALDVVQDAITRHERLQIGVVNAAKIVNMRRNPELGEDVMTSNLILADGMAVVWASRILGRPLPERVAGIDLMYGILERGNKHGYRVYCLGATEEVSAAVAEQITVRYPNVKLVGRRNGYFRNDEDKAVADDIARSRADVLFVAITSPKKERFLAAWSDTMDVPVCHGVGGSFDVMAGKVQRAPESWQRLGLEWLYRVKQEPGRLWKRYLVTNTLFSMIVFKEWLKRMFGRRSRPATDQ